MKLAKLLWVVSMLLVVIGAPRLASAQTIEITNKDSLVRLTPGGDTVTPRAVNGKAVNYADCVDNQRIRIAYKASGFDPNQTLEVWAGQQDCKPIEARNGTTQQCWRPHGDLPRQEVGTVEIPVRNIVKKRTGSSVVDSTGDPSVCSGIPLSTFSLYFMWFQGNGTLPISTDQVDVSVKTQGPGAVTGLSVAPGNARIIVTYGAAGEGGVTDQTSLRVYCDANPAATIAVTKQVLVCADASTSGDASDTGAADAAAEQPSDAGCVERTEVVTPSSECSSTVLSGAAADAGDSGASPPLPDDRYKCAEIGGALGSRVVVEKIGDEPLVNDKSYAVAIAAVDSYGNVGAVGAPLCVMPGETTDFWETYRDGGGGAGGCSVDAAPISTITCILPCAALVVGVLRRRKRKGGNR